MKMRHIFALKDIFLENISKSCLIPNARIICGI